MKLSKDRTYFIAELSANHNGSLQTALETIDAIKESGADAVKVQTFTPDSMTLNLEDPLFMAGEKTIWKGQKLYDLYRKAALPFEWHYDLQKRCNELGLDFFSSPFSKKDVDFLEDLNVPAYKIASLEIADIPLIKYVASKQKPIIISTGIAKLSDIELAIETCYNEGNNNVILLKCTTAYPAPFEEINLNVIPNLKETFNLEIVGLSDHTMGSTVPLGAVALGARVVEKHFILDRKMGGVDSTFSMEPEEFKNMITSVRNLELALGSVNYKLTDKAEDSRKRGRSLFIVENLKKGDILTEDNIKSLRPGVGLHPKYLLKVLGKKVNKDINKGTPFSLFDIEN
ncbi:pseudaminic acid synthase [Flammeovirga sp. MY04]|uniref:pseudaminic acid synthase n=1 Tax=Flammeovirga sp. MY04 TaxID=1191459 RepID=UPI0008063EDD|nr:pseudaminic acid synthase [Flammeovirga sp. MY04]ANQ50234.1 pseudaminic acid synthase [Flammeovirga sp. MY04]